jgi:hypothetical protein
MPNNDENVAEQAARGIERALNISEIPQRPRVFSQLRPIIEPTPTPTTTPTPEPEQIPVKVDHTLLPLDALDEVSKSLMHGRDKYGAWFWVEKAHHHTDLLAKAQRHILAFQRGENIDPTSGLQHIACAICDLMFLQSNIIQGRGTDDRLVREKK